MVFFFVDFLLSFGFFFFGVVSNISVGFPIFTNGAGVCVSVGAVDFFFRLGTLPAARRERRGARHLLFYDVIVDFFTLVFLVELLSYRLARHGLGAARYGLGHLLFLCDYDNR